MQIRIGTRGSKLALWQANTVKKLLSDSGFKPELVEVTTLGDTNQSLSLRDIGEVGLFTKALDQSLLSGEVDIAVHSAKDMPSEVPEGLEIVAFLKREDPRDVVLATSEAFSLENVSRPLVVGTASLRRTALLKHYFKHLDVRPIRGNVDSRIEKLKSGAFDAIMLAYAGVKRMGFTSYIVQKLNSNSFTPAVGQGAIAVVAREGFQWKESLRASLNHEATEIALLGERAFLRKVEGGCNTPVFALAHVMGDRVSLHGGIAAEDGSSVVRTTFERPVREVESLGIELADQILQRLV